MFSTVESFIEDKAKGGIYGKRRMFSTVESFIEDKAKGESLYEIY